MRVQVELWRGNRLMGQRWEADVDVADVDVMRDLLLAAVGDYEERPDREIGRYRLRWRGKHTGSWQEFRAGER